MNALFLASLQLDPLTYVLVWCGMSIVVGASARMLVPGRRLHGTLATFLLGFFSTILCSFLLKIIYLNFFNIEEFNPIQFMTLIVSAVVGAVGLFLFESVAKLFRKK